MKPEQTCRKKGAACRRALAAAQSRAPPGGNEGQDSWRGSEEAGVWREKTVLRLGDHLGGKGRTRAEPWNEGTDMGMGSHHTQDLHLEKTLPQGAE